MYNNETRILANAIKLGNLFILIFSSAPPNTHELIKWKDLAKSYSQQQ